MIELDSSELVFRFPEVHEAANLRVGFQRTLRIPDDNGDYPLPPGLGNFPLNLVDDYADRVAATWKTHGGVFLPMYQSEAMWINFETSYPMAVKVAAGKVDALTGEPWKDELSEHPQDYLVAPEQPWLDGFCVEDGLVRQFVAMPLGQGYTVEEQLVGEARHGGLQIAVYPMKASRFQDLHLDIPTAAYSLSPPTAADSYHEMGLAPGGLMRQEVYEDEYGFSAWAKSVRSRCFVHVLNSLQFLEVTGVTPPGEPPAAKDYAEAGLPWFEYFGGDLVALKGSETLPGLDSVAAMKEKQGKGPLADNEPIQPTYVMRLEGKTVGKGESE